MLENENSQLKKKVVVIDHELSLNTSDEKHRELNELKEMHELLKSKLHKCEQHAVELEIINSAVQKKITDLEHENAILDKKVKELINDCEGKDHEIYFFKTEMERLNFKLQIKSHSPPPFQKIISSAQKGSSGLGYKCSEKGKSVLYQKNACLNPNELSKDDFHTRFCKAKINYDAEITRHDNHPKNNMNAHAYKGKKAAPLRKPVNKYRSRGSFYYKSAPTHHRGPKSIWVPKKFIMPFTDSHREAWKAGMGSRFWVIAAHDGEQVLVPRLYSHQ